MVKEKPTNAHVQCDAEKGINHMNGMKSKHIHFDGKYYYIWSPNSK